ncbi:MAG: hypothetical protein NTZ69_17010 [Bacteroidia bacterium]|nr:hypothetical protein [Bacteroidia bacterium]
MKIKNILLWLFIILPAVSDAQPSYLTGTSQASIEPDQSLISLHLAGYGSPREGRFTLQWINKGAVPEVTAMGGLSDKLYIVSNGDLLCMNPAENNPTWKKAGKAENIRSIAGINGKLYAVNNKGELLETKVQGRIKWKKIGPVDNSVTSLTATDNKLFAANANGSLWAADLWGKSIGWLKGETVDSIVSLAANKGKLYALTNGGAVYQCEPGKKDHKWLKIAYKNGQTIKEDIKHITVINDRIFGISKDNFLYMGEHRSDGNLTARAMAVKNGEKTVVIVNVDVCGLNDTFTGLVKREIYQKNHIPAPAVFINCTHTHFAPVTQDWLTWQEPNQRPDSIYLYSTVKNGILYAVDNALKTMAPAELSFGRGKTDIGRNGQLKDHPELYDSAVDVIKVGYPGKDAESYLFLTACHPELSTAGKLHYTISANYPGVARKLVEERTGTSNSMFLQGTAGDINPSDNGEYISGEKLANEVIAILNRPMTKINGQVTCYLDTINIPVTPWTKEEIHAYRAQNSDKPGNADAEKNVKWCDLMLKYYSEGTMPVSLPVYVQTINIGNWKLVGFSREATTGYSFGVKNLWPDKLVSVAGYTNDVSSYLPTHMHIEKRGYVGLNSFFWYGMPAVFPMNVDETILNRIKSLDR